MSNNHDDKPFTIFKSQEEIASAIMEHAQSTHRACTELGYVPEYVEFDYDKRRKRISMKLHMRQPENKEAFEEVSSQLETSELDRQREEMKGADTPDLDVPLDFEISFDQ